MSDQELSIDLRRLVQFLAVIEHESLTAAADRLAMTPQTLSTAMRQLEQSVGVSLFDRRGRRMLVTAAGQRLREGAPMLLAAATALVEATRQAATGRQASFVVGHTPAITAEEVFTIIEPVRAALPDVAVTARQLFPSDMAQALLDGTIDVGLRRGATTPAGFAGAVIGYDELHVAVSAGHPLTKRASVTLADIGAYSLIVWAAPTFSFYTDFLVTACRGAGFEPTVVVNKMQGTPPVTAVVGNDHVALVTAPVGPALQGRVEVRPLVDPPLMPIQALWLPHTTSEARTVLLARD